MSNHHGNGTGPRAQQAQRNAAEREQLANDLARWAGQEAAEEHDEDVASQPEGRHYTYCCERAHEDAARNEYAFCMELPLDKLRARHASSSGLGNATYAERLLVRVCDASGDIERAMAKAAGAIPSDVRRAGHAAEAHERYLHHYGQAPDAALLASMRARLRYLTHVEPPPGWEDRAVDRAKREGVIP